MQITGTNPYGAMEARFDRPSTQPFRPITADDLTLRGIMRRIAEQNLGKSIDFQA